MSYLYKRLIQLFENDTGQHKGMSINFEETIDTNNTNEVAKICSVEMIKLQNVIQILLVGIGHKNYSELQIYQKQSNDKNNKYVFKNTLQFEDNGKYINNSTITTNNHIFVKAYSSLGIISPN